jgi:hypothetical protein
MSAFKSLCDRYFSEYQLKQLVAGGDVTQRVLFDTVTSPASDFSADERAAAETILNLWAQPTRSLNTSDEFGVSRYAQNVRVYPYGNRIISIDDFFIVDSYGSCIRLYATQAEAEASVRGSLQNSYDADEDEVRYGVQ